MIRGLQEKWAVSIDVEDDGTVQVAGVGADSINGARSEIEALCEEIKVGTVYAGKVVSIKDFGAFIELAPGTDGMCHISELAEGYVKTVSGGRQARRHREGQGHQHRRPGPQGRDHGRARRDLRPRPRG